MGICETSSGRFHIFSIERYTRFTGFLKMKVPRGWGFSEPLWGRFLHKFVRGMVGTHRHVIIVA